MSISNRFVISLDRTPDRMRDFEKVNAHLQRVSRFSAVDGKQVSHAELRRQGLFAEPIFYTDGAVGCALSHLRLWNFAVGGRSYTTVFEDDAIVHRDFETISAALIADLSLDWDIILWGWNFDGVLSFDVFPNVPCLSYFSQVDMHNQWEAIQKNMTRRPALHRLHYTFGTVAYSISPRGAERLTALTFPIRPFRYKVPQRNFEFENLGIDSVMAACYDHLNAYVCFPPLVLTRNEHAGSTVQENTRRDAPRHARWIRSLRRIKQRLLGTTPAVPADADGFRLIPSEDYPNGRKYAERYARYLSKNGHQPDT